MKKSLSTILLCAMLLGTLSAASCGDAGDTDPETSANEDASSSSAEDVPEYNWASLDCGEEDFVLLNSTDEYGFYDYIDFEATTGEGLNDKVFERNRELEDKYNFRLKVIDENFNDASTKLRQAVSSDSDDYDAAFVWVNNLSGMLSEGCFTNLSDVKTLNLDSAWWDTATDNDMKIGNNGKLYFAFCNISLVKFEGTQAIFLNQSKMERLGLDMPYQLVRDGKWTLDEFNKARVSRREPERRRQLQVGQIEQRRVRNTRMRWNGLRAYLFDRKQIH